MNGFKKNSRNHVPRIEWSTNVKFSIGTSVLLRREKEDLKLDGVIFINADIIICWNMMKVFGNSVSLYNFFWCSYENFLWNDAWNLKFWCMK